MADIPVGFWIVCGALVLVIIGFFTWIIIDMEKTERIIRRKKFGWGDDE